MNTSDFTIFLDVARLGSFAAAARLRNTAPSSISRSVQALEVELGVRLFQRSTRQVTLTEAGDLLRARAAPLIDELDHAISDARTLRDRPVGLLRLTASIAFGDFYLMPRLRRFRDLYPDVTLECIFTDSFLDLVADRIDLAIRLAPAVEGDLIVSKLIDTRYRVVATPGYLATAPGLERPGDLAMHGAILYNQRPFRDRWLFRDAAGIVTEVALRSDIRLTPAGSVYQAARLGFGPALLPDWLVGADIAEGRLRHCLSAWDVTATTFDTSAWIVYPSRALLPAKVRALIEVLRQSV
jgi:DNA-binding transcriptional LysR family regulator